MQVLLLGLDFAGKTTLMGRLRFNRLIQAMPTNNPQSHDIQIGNCKLRTFDMGGHTAVRKLWKEYMLDLDGIIFVVDAADRARFGEVKVQLSGLLNDPQIRDVPFLLLANKIDLPTAASREELTAALGLFRHLDGETMRMEMCSIHKGLGYVDGIKWFAGKF